MKSLIFVLGLIFSVVLNASGAGICGPLGIACGGELSIEQVVSTVSKAPCEPGEILTCHNGHDVWCYCRAEGSSDFHQINPQDIIFRADEQQPARMNLDDASLALDQSGCYKCSPRQICCDSN